MSWRDQWIGLDARLQGLLNASRFYAQGLAISRADPFNLPDKVLKPQIDDFFRELRNFRDIHSGQLPIAAAAAIERFFQRHSEYFAGNVKGHFAVVATITSLTALGAEVS